MTRCSSSSLSIDHYLQKVHSKPPQDPTLLFHSHGGADIVTVVPHYRPDDHANYGYAIMIRYSTQAIVESHTDNSDTYKEEDHDAIVSNGTVIDDGSHNDSRYYQRDFNPVDECNTDSSKLEHALTTAEVLSYITDIVQGTIASLVVDTARHLENDDDGDESDGMGYVDKSFMHLGLDSLSMMEMRNRLNALYHKYLTASEGVSPSAATAPTPASTHSHQLSPTLLFDFPTPTLLAAEFNRQLHIQLHARKAKSSCDSPVSTSRQTSVIASLSSPPPIAQRSSSSSSSSSVASSFAVIGMSCRFPGGCNVPDLFHRKLCDGLDTITTIPTDWHWNAHTKHVSVLNDSDAEVFDPGYFQLNSKEAELMDPHQRLILELCNEALIDARMLEDDNKGKGMGCMMDTMTIGVFVGLCNNEWLASSSSLNDEVGPYSSTGTAMSATANRVSFLLGLTGPSMVIDTGQLLYLVYIQASYPHLYCCCLIVDRSFCFMIDRL